MVVVLGVLDSDALRTFLVENWSLILAYSIACLLSRSLEAIYTRSVVVNGVEGSMEFGSTAVLQYWYRLFVTCIFRYSCRHRGHDWVYGVVVDWGYGTRGFGCLNWIIFSPLENLLPL